MKLFIITTIIYLFNTNFLLAKTFEYFDLSTRLNSSPFCQSVSFQISPISSIMNNLNINIDIDAMKSQLKEVPSLTINNGDKDENKDTLVTNILNCLDDKNIIKDNCDKEVWSSAISRNECLENILIYYSNVDKEERFQNLKIEEGCIIMSNKMITDAAFNKMFENCMKQNNY